MNKQTYIFLIKKQILEECLVEEKDKNYINKDYEIKIITYFLQKNFPKKNIFKKNFLTLSI